MVWVKEKQAHQAKPNCGLPARIRAGNTSRHVEAVLMLSEALLEVGWAD